MDPGTTALVAAAAKYGLKEGVAAIKALLPGARIEEALKVPSSIRRFKGRPVKWATPWSLTDVSDRVSSFNERKGFKCARAASPTRVSLRKSFSRPSRRAKWASPGPS